MEAKSRIAAPACPAVLLASRPEHDRQYSQDSAEEQPIKGVPLPGCAVGSISEQIRVHDIRRAGKLNEVGGDVQRAPHKSICGQKSNVKRIAYIFIGRDRVHEERKHGEEDKEGEVSEQQLRGIQSKLEAMVAVPRLHDDAAQ